MVFEVLYSRLVFLHEPAGRLMFGESWPARRLYVLAGLKSDDTLLDLGSGEGRLLLIARKYAKIAVGVEPSAAMRRKARARGSHILQGCAQHVPLPNRSMTRIVSTYPGPWILDTSCWREMRRLLGSGGEVSILLGGTYAHGPFAKMRGFAQRVVYGDTGPPWDTMHCLKAMARESDICLRLRIIHDRWGKAYLLTGTVT